MSSLSLIFILPTGMLSMADVLFLNILRVMLNSAFGVLSSDNRVLCLNKRCDNNNIDHSWGAIKVKVICCVQKSSLKNNEIWKYYN